MPLFNVFIDSDRMPGVDFFRDRHNRLSGQSLTTPQFLSFFLNQWAAKGIRFANAREGQRLQNVKDNMTPEDKAAIKAILDKYAPEG